MEYFLIGFCAWAAKELYQSFVGSRAKTAEQLSTALLKISILETKLDNQSEALKSMRQELQNHYSKERAYRKS